MRRRRPKPALPAPEGSRLLLVRLAPSSVAMFRFLLEGYGHLALFTVLDRQAALLKLVFSPHQEGAVREALADIAKSVDIRVEPWPLPARWQ